MFFNHSGIAQFLAENFSMKGMSESRIHTSRSRTNREYQVSLFSFICSI